MIVTSYFVYQKIREDLSLQVFLYFSLSPSVFVVIFIHRYGLYYLVLSLECRVLPSGIGLRRESLPRHQDRTPNYQTSMSPSRPHKIVLLNLSSRCLGRRGPSVSIDGPLLSLYHGRLVPHPRYKGEGPFYFRFGCEVLLPRCVERSRVRATKFSGKRFAIRGNDCKLFNNRPFDLKLTILL